MMPFCEADTNLVPSGENLQQRTPSEELLVLSWDDDLQEFKKIKGTTTCNMCFPGEFNLIQLVLYYILALYLIGIVKSKPCLFSGVGVTAGLSMPSLHCL